MLDLVEKLFARYGIRSLRYDGSMDRHARETALSTFKKAGGPKVILIRCVMGAMKLVHFSIALNFKYEVWWCRIEVRICCLIYTQLLLIRCITSLVSANRIVK